MVEKSSVTKIELSISASGLNMQTDPSCIVLFLDPKSSRYIECNRTEPSIEKSNPSWSKKIMLNYFFEGRQDLRFSIEDSSEKLFGVFDVPLGFLVAKGTITGQLGPENSGKTLTISTKEIKPNLQIITMHLRAHNVDKMDFFGKSDPYFIFYRQSRTEGWAQVYKSEIIKKTLDPIWKPFEMNSQDLCSCDSALPLKIEVWDWDRGSSDDFIGAAEFTLSQLQQPNARFQLIDPNKYKKNPKKYQNSGILEVASINFKRNLSFVELLQTGIQLNLAIGIDFTSSNGNFRERSSLHYFDQDFQNEYERAILSIGNVIECYNDEKLFSVFGFGGEPEWSRKIDHCFALNRSNSNPSISTLANVIRLYHQTLPSIKFAGPTLFQFMVKTGNLLSQTIDPCKEYLIMLILTDGEIHDISQTINAIVESSYLPVSILIVGVGLESFSGMQQLSEYPLKDDNGRQSARNNTQFVQFRNFGGNGYLMTNFLLARIPAQVVEYMELIQYNPQCK